MILTGRQNLLRAVRKTQNGFYFGDDKGNEVLLPNKFVTPEIEIGTVLNLFIYNDHLNRLVATTQQPLIEYRKCACLKVVEVSEIGAFLDWGLDKHLFIPNSEQMEKLIPGQKIVVLMYIDIVFDRLVASQRIDRFILNHTVELEQGQKIHFQCWRKTPLGYNLIIENQYIGLLFHSNTYKKLEVGEEGFGYVLNIREDNKIDITLNRFEVENPLDATKIIMKVLNESTKSFLPYNDNSPSDDIVRTFGMSKKTFKKAIGSLYKQRLIVITEDGIKKNSVS